MGLNVVGSGGGVVTGSSIMARDEALSVDGALVVTMGGLQRLPGRLELVKL